MQAGKLRHRVEVQEDRPTTNDFNEPEAGWRTVARRWAEVTQISGDDKLVRDQWRQTATHRVRIRFMAGLTVRHRLKHDGRYLHVLAIDNLDERDREMIITCEERLGE